MRNKKMETILNKLLKNLKKKQEYWEKRAEIIPSDLVVAQAISSVTKAIEETFSDLEENSLR